MAPSRDALGIAVAGLFPWDGLAALWAQAGWPCGLGPALSLQARHGGKPTHDQLDAQPSAVRLRGGRLPPAAVSPAARRAPRALHRRRTPGRRPRAAWRAPIHKPTRPSTRPALGQKSASTA